MRERNVSTVRRLMPRMLPTSEFVFPRETHHNTSDSRRLRLGSLSRKVLECAACCFLEESLICCCVARRRSSFLEATLRLSRNRDFVAALRATILFLNSGLNVSPCCQ